MVVHFNPALWLCVCLASQGDPCGFYCFHCLFQEKSRRRSRFEEREKDFVTSGPSANWGNGTTCAPQITDHPRAQMEHGRCVLVDFAFVTSFPCVQTPGGVVSGPLGVSGRRSRSRQAERQVICLPQNARCVLSTGSANGSRRGSAVEGELSAEIAEHQR